MTTVHAGCNICEQSWLPWFEAYYRNELERSDYANMSFATHLEHFLDPEWTAKYSFCMDGEEMGPTEAYVGNLGLCFFVNSKQKIYDLNKWVDSCSFRLKF